MHHPENNVTQPTARGKQTGPCNTFCATRGGRGARNSVNPGLLPPARLLAYTHDIAAENQYAGWWVRDGPHGQVGRALRAGPGRCMRTTTDERIVEVWASRASHKVFSSSVSSRRQTWHCGTPKGHAQRVAPASCKGSMEEAHPTAKNPRETTPERHETFDDQVWKAKAAQRGRR
jgi:hypothetical protein